MYPERGMGKHLLCSAMTAEEPVGRRGSTQAVTVTAGGREHYPTPAKNISNETLICRDIADCESECFHNLKKMG
jgi:hypothetical protein